MRQMLRPRWKVAGAAVVQAACEEKDREEKTTTRWRAEKDREDETDERRQREKEWGGRAWPTGGF